MRISIMVLAVAFLGACADAPQEYGVVLWSRDVEAPPTGSIVIIGELSEVSGLLSVSPPGEEHVQLVEPGLIKRFDTLNEAHDYSRGYDVYEDAFATADVQALRVRSQPSTESADLYRLRRGEEVKLVGQAGQAQTIDGATGYWQEVITRSGIRGYSFGPFLRLPLERGGGETTQQISPSGDWRERLLSQIWRPAYMREMIRLEQIDLRKFDPNIGLFPDGDSSSLVLDTGKSRRTFDLTNPDLIGDGTYLFDDGELQIRFLDVGDLLVRYRHNGNAIAERYVLLEAEMENAIEAERQRRTEMYETILSHGSRYRSSSYGTLVFAEEDRIVRWNARQILVPDVIPQTASETARVRFDVFVSAALSDDYDGAMSLLFDMGSRQHELNLLYELLPSGIRWTLVSQESARDGLIQEAPPSALVLFFSQVVGGPG